MRLTLLLAVLISVSFSLNAQVVPCVDGMAGEYPCSGFDFVSRVALDDLGITGNGNDIWGWTDPLNNNEYAIMGGSNRTVFVDITDAVNPVFIGYLETATNSSLWRDIKVYNNHAFIVSEAGEHGLQVFDLTRLRNAENLPVQFTTDAYNSDFGSAHNIAINEETGFAYVIGAGTFDGGPHFFDISDPLNPTSVGGYDGDGYTHDAQIVVYDGPDIEHHCKEIFFGYNGNSLTIVDVTDKSDPTLISRMEYDFTGYTHQGWLSEDQTFAFMNDEKDEQDFDVNTRTLIVNVSDLDNPQLIQEYFSDNAAIDHNLYVHGDKIYESNYQSGLRVLEISDDPQNMLSEAGYFDVYPQGNSANFSGTWSNYPYFESGNIIVSSMDRGLIVVKSSDIVPNEVVTNEVDCNCASSAKFVEQTYKYCEGFPSAMSVAFQGEAPFTLEYSINGVAQTPIVTNLNPYNLLAFDEAAVYRLDGVSDAACYRQVISEASLISFDPISIIPESIQEICSSDSSTYIVSFEVEGGDATTYQNGGNTSGMLTNEIFISEQIQSGESYNIVVNDFCTSELIEDMRDCFVGIEEQEKIEFKLYPNPATESLNIVLDQYVDLSTITIKDITGRILYNNTNIIHANGKFQIDLSTLSNGTYFILLNNSSVKRFVKE